MEVSVSSPFVGFRRNSVKKLLLNLETWRLEETVLNFQAGFFPPDVCVVLARRWPTHLRCMNDE